jgi:hypothetical protein
MIEAAAQWLTIAVISFLSIGLQEAVIKPIAKSFFKRKIVKYAPVAMRFLDQEMTRMLAQDNGKQMEASLIEQLECLTGESWKKSEIDELFSLYDPRITANIVNNSDDKTNPDK